MKFKRIFEGIKLDTDNLTFNYKENDKDSISLHLGKDNNFSPYTKNIDGLKILSLYSSKNKADILKKLKNAEMNQELNQFLNRTVIYLLKVIKDKKINTIISIKSSSSLNEMILNKISERFYGKIIKNGFEKNEVSNITINKNDPRINDELGKKLEDYLHKAKEKNTFNLKNIMPKDRKFFKNVYKTNILNPKDIDNKNILIFDDILTVGYTMLNVKEVLKKSFNPKSVAGLTLFKN